MAQGIFLEPGEGMTVRARGSLMQFKAVSDTTGGAFSLMERELPMSNRRPQLHTPISNDQVSVREGWLSFPRIRIKR